MTTLQRLCFDMICTARPHISALIAMYPGAEALLPTLCRHPSITTQLKQLDTLALEGQTHACKAGTKTLYRLWRTLLDETCPQKEPQL